MREQPLDLRQSLAVLGRRWIAIAVIGTLGLFGGAFYALLHPTQPTAEALVLLPAQAASSADIPATDMKTQVLIATSDAVLTPAGELVSPAITGDQLQHLVTVTAADNVLRVEVRGPQTGRDVVLANAVAAEYRAYVTKTKAVSASPTPLQPATVVSPHSTISRALKSGLIGLAVGLLLATIIVLVQARRDHRLRRRDEIAASIGVPVVASMEAEEYKTVAEWSRLLERFEPSPVNAWTLRRVVRSLVPADIEGRFSIRVISFAGDRAALATGPQLALFAAESGIPTRLAPDEHAALEPLIAACATVRVSGHGEQLLTFGTEDETWYGPTGRPVRWDDDPVLTDPQLVVSVLTVERSHPQLSSFVGPTLLSVSSGFAVVDDLALVALASIRGGLGIDGIVVINPDPGDSSVGLVPDRDTGSWGTRDSGGQQASGSTAMGWAG